MPVGANVPRAFLVLLELQLRVVSMWKKTVKMMPCTLLVQNFL